MKIFLNSVGCRLNQSEIERISNHFRVFGHEIVGSADECELAIINTCTVTSPAAADSRAMVRRTHKKNPKAKIILTGCWSTLEEKKALDLPGVVRVVHNNEKDRFVPLILDLPNENFNLEPIIREPVPGTRMRTRAFIKAQDGCDNRCAFCITTIARGPARSMPQEQILAEIQSAVLGGIQEAVLTGVQLTAYGKDLNNNITLQTLIESIFHHTDLPRLRLSSLEPWEVGTALLDLWDNERLCRQIHLPLQSGSNSTLRRMGRPITSQKYASIVAQARERIPSVAITTDIIVGFPGETEEEFQETLDFVKEIRFARAHVFVYSPRSGTSAFLLPNKVPNKVARLRSRQIREIQSESSQDYRNGFLGKELIALWEVTSLIDQDKWEMKGLTDNYLRVCAISDQNLWNRLTPVRILDCTNDELRAEILPDKHLSETSHKEYGIGFKQDH
jgi:threonylcarbamoyladenosine tRNA methylthiotransferase MtaB